MKAFTHQEARCAVRNIGTIFLLTFSFAMPRVFAQKSEDGITRSFPVNPYPDGMAFDGTNIWVTSYSTSGITELRASDGALVRTVPIGVENIGIAFDGTYVWVALNDGHVVRIRPADGSIEGSYWLGDHELNYVLFDGKDIWVSSFDSLLFKLRQSDAKVLRKLTLNSDYTDTLSLTFDGTHIWATNAYQNTVTKIRARDGTIQGTYDAGDFPWGIAFDGLHIWIASDKANALLKLRVSDGALLATIPLTSPSELEFDGQHIWVTSDWTDSVTRIDPRTDVVENTFAVGSIPGGVLFDGKYIWVANWASSTVTRIRRGR